VLERRTGLVFACFASQNRQKREESHFLIKFQDLRRFVIKITIPAKWHRNGEIPALGRAWGSNQPTNQQPTLRLGAHYAASAATRASKSPRRA